MHYKNWGGWVKVGRMGGPTLPSTITHLKLATLALASEEI